MKKALFIFFVIVLSGITIAGTVKTYKDNETESHKEEMKEFLSSELGIFYYDPKKKDFSSKTRNSIFSHYRFSPIDGVYFTSAGSKKPISLKKNGNTTIITISEGEYVFELNDIFEKYEVHAEDFNISQLGKGMFYVNNVKGNYRIYSFNSLLRLDLLSKPKTKVTFDLFPSLLFKYNPEYNKNLISLEFDPQTKKNVEKSADVLRISQIDPIIYVDSKGKKFYSQVMDNPAEDNLIKIAISDINLKFQKYGQLLDMLVNMDIKDIPGAALSKDYSSFFQNQTKKAIYLKNSIAKNFVSFLKNSGDKNKVTEIESNITAIEDSLSQMQEVSDVLYNEGTDIIKNYYYISYFGNILGNIDSIDFRQGGVGAGMKRIFKDKIAGEDYFGELSDLFFTYQFSEANKDVIDSGIDVYLGGLMENKVLKGSDFLNFSFFLTQYSLSEDRISKSSLNIVKYLIDMSNSFYLTIRDSDKVKEGEKKFSTLSVQFYSLTKIIKKLNNSIISNFFEKKPDNSVQLKAEYSQEFGDTVQATISKDITQGLSSLYSQGIKDMQNKKPEFMKYLTQQKVSSSSTKNNYTLLEEQYAKLHYISEEVLANYNSWSKKQNLKKEFRDAKEVIYEESVVMNKAELLAYLSNFNGTDVSSLKLLNENSLMKDGFYNASINVNNSVVEFKLYPEGHKLSNISITDPNTGNKKSYQTSIVLDDKEELYRDLYSAASTESNKRKYDFKNFLENILNLGYESSDVTGENDDTEIKPVESNYISLFKQNKLIDGDFTFIKKFISIPFSSINVTIVNEEYVITIKGAEKTFTTDGRSFSIKLDCSYNFVSKKFEDIRFYVMRESGTGADPYELGGNEVTVSPSVIGLKEFSTKLNLAEYLEVLVQNYIQGATNMKVDLNSSKVYIDSKSFPVNE